jgi:hypothetical protein
VTGDYQLSYWTDGKEEEERERGWGRRDGGRVEVRGEEKRGEEGWRRRRRGMGKEMSK